MTIHQDITETYAILSRLHGDLGQALGQLHDQRGGYPTRTTGASATTSTTSFLDRDAPNNDERCTLTAVEAAALSPDTATTELRIVATDAQAMLRAAHRIARIIEPRLEPVPARSTQGDIPEDWCRSCWRNDHHHTAIELRPNGTPYYAGLCRWCGLFKTEHKALPDLELLRLRHQARRITTADIDGWKRRRAQTKKTKKTKGA